MLGNAQRTSKGRQQRFFSLAFLQALFTHKCVYTGRTRTLKSGCARYCNATVKVRSVCGQALIQAIRAHTEAGRAGRHQGHTLGPQVLCNHRLPWVNLAMSSCKGIEGWILYTAARSPPSLHPPRPWCPLTLNKEPTLSLPPTLTHPLLL